MRKTVVIIGFGFCGRLAFYHLSKQKNISLIIFDKHGENFIGPAFSNFSSSYILNVPASKMSAFSNNPTDFHDFLSHNYSNLNISPDDFAPRYLYGEYLKQITQQAFENAQKNNLEVKFVAQEVLKINHITDGFEILDASQNIYKASQVLMATSFKQSDLRCDFDSKQLLKKLWSSEAKSFHQDISVAKHIGIIGSGLTAVDVIIGLKAKNFTGKITVISRRGNFPKKHFPSKQITLPSVIEVSDAKKGILFICLRIREFLSKNPQFDLRHVVDSLRPITRELWQNFDDKNKRMFWRLMPYWNIFRHRAPISSILAIEDMIKKGQIEVRKKGLKSIEQSDDKILVKLDSETLEFDYFVNCLGFEFTAKQYPLMHQMMEDKLLEKDFVLAKSNHTSLYLLGGLNIARDFEITSVPDLRVDVEEVVSGLVSGLKSQLQ